MAYDDLGSAFVEDDLGPAPTMQYTDLGPAPQQKDMSGIRAFGEEFGLGIARGFLNVGRGLVGAAEWAIPGEQEWLIEAMENIEEVKGKIPHTHEGAAGWAGNILGQALPYMGSALVGAHVAGAAGAAAGLKGVGLKIATGAGAATIGFSVEGQDAYDTAIRAGATKAEANKDRVIVGSINAIIEAVQIGQLMKFQAAGKHSIKNLIRMAKRKVSKKLIGKELAGFTGDVVKHGINEALEEMGQEVTSLAVPGLLRGVWKETPEGKPDWVGMAEQVAMAGAAGGFAGVVLGGAGAAVGLGVVAQPTAKEVQVVKENVLAREDISPERKSEWLNELDRIDAVLDGVIEDSDVEPATGVERDIEYKDMNPLEVKLNIALKEVQRARPAHKKQIKRERAKRFEKFRKAEKVPESAREGYLSGLSKMKGKMGLTLESVRDSFTEFEADYFYGRVRDSVLSDTDRMHAYGAFEKLLIEGEIPSRSEIDALKTILKPETVNNLLKTRQSMGLDRWAKFMDSLNISRSLLASGDASAGGRQGWMLLGIAPKQWLQSIGRGYRAAANETYQKFQYIQMVTDPYWDLFLKSEGSVTKIGSVLSTEEMFSSELAHRLPIAGEVVKASERAYVTTLNSLRFYTFKKYAKQWEGTGKTKEDYRTLARFINHASGRGDWGRLKRYMPALDVMFFAPRLFIGRIQAIGDLFTATNPVRKIIAKDLVATLAVGMAAMGLYSMISGSEVEKNPLSTDFGKVKIGDVRVDFWAGYQQIFRSLAQFVAGKTKTPLGEMKDVDRKNLIWRFLQSKMSPVAGASVDILRGENFLGEKLSADPEGVAKEAFDRFVPLFIQDLADSIRYEGLKGGSIVGPLALHGVGVATYPLSPASELKRYKNTESQRYFGKNWDDLGSDSQQALYTAEPSITLQEEKVRLERENYSFVAKMIEEQNAASRKVTEALPKGVQEAMKSLYIGIPGMTRRIGNGWFLNNERYERYQDDLAAAYGKILPNIIDAPMFKSMSFGVQREVLDRFIKDIGKMVRSKIIDDVNRADLLDYFEAQ